ncbi:MAG: ATP-binding protein [Cytophagales bacterium]|nr:ATP-binding protein [Cytophagales bacterium]
MSDEIAILKRHLARERAARKQAEELLDSKTLDLHQVNQELSDATETLKSLLSSRTAIISNLVTNLSSGILLENEVGEILFANQVFCDQFEITAPPDKLVGKKLSRSLQDFERIFADPEQFYNKLPRVFEANEKVLNESIELKSGITIEGDFIPIDIMGVHKGRLWQFRDITERKTNQRSIEQSERRFKLLAAYYEFIRGASLRALLAKTTTFLKQEVEIEEISISLVESPIESLNSWMREQVTKVDNPLVKLFTAENMKALDQKPIYLDDITADTSDQQGLEWLVRGFRSALNMPLILEGDFLGVLSIASRQIDGISEDTKRFFALFEPRLTYALKNLILIQDLEWTKDTIKQSEEKYRGIMENMELGLMEVDNDDTIIKVYDRFCKLTGYGSWELIGRKASEVFVLPEYKHVLDDQHKDRDRGISGVYEIEIPTKSGERKWVLISGAPYYDSNGKKMGTIGIHLDISDRKKMEQNLIQVTSEAKKAQEAEKIFLANMSHEIRNPLNAVIGMSHLLEDTNPTKEQQEYLGYIKNSSQTLMSLISDILDLSKIHANEISFHPVEISLKKTVRDIQSMFEVRCLEKGIQFQFQYDDNIELKVYGDQLILHQILNNLLGNALKFTDEGGNISLHVDLLVRKDNNYQIMFTVEDSGIGIKEEHLADIFTEFKQADSSTKIKYGGTGLGLAISQKLVTLHGGSIDVESTEGEGSTFQIVIPFEYTENADRAQVEKPRETFEEMNVGRVLIVEDNPVNRKYLSRTLQKWHISCDEAENGRIALEKLEAATYDLLIMDIRMPEMDGYEAIGRIRKHPEDHIRNIMAIALTADAMREEREKAYHQGFNYHITKPFKSEELRSKLMELATFQTEEPHITPEEKLSIDTYFDQEALNRLYEGDEEYMIEMFQIFKRTTPKELEGLQASMDKEDWEECKSILHRAKPTFEMVGRPGLTKIAGQFEAIYDKEKVLSKTDLGLFMVEVRELLKKVDLEIKKTK